MIDIVQKGAEIAGGLGRLATQLGITHQAFYSWRRVPAERVIDFERVTGIPRHEIRPDLYPHPDPIDGEFAAIVPSGSGHAPLPQPGPDGLVSEAAE